MKTIEENFANEQYQHVLLGEVTSVRELPGTQGPEYTIEVAATYRGEASGNIELDSAAHSCGSLYNKGDIYVWYLDEPDYVDELNPQYRFDSLEQARDRMSEFIQSQESSANEPYVEGPTTAPGVGFVGPQSPPPGQETAGNTETEMPWYQKLWAWIRGLFK
jgi:hypothetical protein